MPSGYIICLAKTQIFGSLQIIPCSPVKHDYIYIYIYIYIYMATGRDRVLDQIVVRAEICKWHACPGSYTSCLEIQQICTEVSVWLR